MAPTSATPFIDKPEIRLVSTRAVLVMPRNNPVPMAPGKDRFLIVADP
jgi:hypothetical protein